MFSLLKLKQKNSNHCSTERHFWICKLFLPIGWKLVTDDGREDVTYTINMTCEEELLTSIFHACDTKRTGKLKITCSNVCSIQQVLSIVREREMVHMWCSVVLCLHTWWMAVQVLVISL